MFWGKKLMERLDALGKKLDAMILAIQALQGAIAEQGEPPAFKLDDAKMQEGISNLMGFDPFAKKRGDE